MDIDSYFQHNGIVPRDRSFINGEHARVENIIDESEYYEEYYQIGMDEDVTGLDYDIHKQFFEILLNEAQAFQDIFEPCCGSGILGCYIASITGAQYHGMDKSKAAIEKAKLRAVNNGLSPDIFQVGDIMEYNMRHSLVIGKGVMYGGSNELNLEMAAKLVEISDNIVLIQTAPPRLDLATHNRCKYEGFFDNRNYAFDKLSDYERSPANGCYLFVMKATKR